MKYISRLFSYLYIFYKKLGSLFSQIQYLQIYKKKKVDHQVSTEELFFSKHQLERLIKEGKIRLPQTLHQDQSSLYHKSISEQTLDEYREQLLQEMENEGLIVLKNESLRNRQPACLAEHLLGCPW